MIWAGTSTERARRLVDGTYEALVVVDRGYIPSRIDPETGVPTTLRFELKRTKPEGIRRDGMQ